MSAERAEAVVARRGHFTLVEGKVVALKEVESIASLPSRDDLLSKVLFLINAQAQRLVTVLQAVPRNLAIVTEQVRAQKEAQGA